MAKSGIDYFPLDVILDEKFELIEAEYGLTGFGVKRISLSQPPRTTLQHAKRSFQVCGLDCFCGRR